MSIVVEAGALLLAIAMIVGAGSQMSAPITTSPWLMPLLLAVAMAMVSAALLVGELRTRRPARVGQAGSPDEGGRAGDEGHAGDGTTRPIQPLQVAGWLALSAGYAVMTPVLGFEAATLIFLVLALRIFSHAGWIATFAIAAGMAFVVPLVFRHVFFTLVP